MTKTYARVENGTVAEVLVTDANPAHLFHPALHWVEVSEPGVVQGWQWGAAGFRPPVAAAIPARPTVATLAELHARVTELEATVADLRPR